MEDKINTIKIFSKDYSSVLLDMDGVLFDSNFQKEHNIYSSVINYYPRETAKKFTEYFIALNGVPREEKIFGYFPNTEVAEKILYDYNKLNDNSLGEVSFIPGVKSFIEYLANKKVPLHLLSGGGLKEVNWLLANKKVKSYFSEIMGGPLKKKENLEKVTLKKPVIYFGDSNVDFEISQLFNYDFVFVSGYTQFINWQSFFSNKENKVIRDFKQLQYD